MRFDTLVCRLLDRFVVTNELMVAEQHGKIETQLDGLETTRGMD